MGLDEVLDDKTFGFGTHNLKIGPGGIKSARWRRQKNLALFKPLLKLYSSPNNSLSNNIQTRLVEPLSNDINILTMEKWSENEILLRLENLNEMNNVTVTPDVINILQPRTYKKCQVVNLIGQPVDFQMDFQEMFRHRKSCKNITLAPLEIKSFLLSW
jgi:hypothetical protein